MQSIHPVSKPPRKHNILHAWPSAAAEHGRNMTHIISDAQRTEATQAIKTKYFRTAAAVSEPEFKLNVPSFKPTSHPADPVDAGAPTTTSATRLGTRSRAHSLVQTVCYCQTVCVLSNVCGFLEIQLIPHTTPTRCKAPIQMPSNTSKTHTHTHTPGVGDGVAPSVTSVHTSAFALSWRTQNAACAAANTLPYADLLVHGTLSIPRLQPLRPVSPALDNALRAQLDGWGCKADALCRRMHRPPASNPLPPIVGEILHRFGLVRFWTAYAVRSSVDYCAR